MWRWAQCSPPFLNIRVHLCSSVVNPPFASMSTIHPTATVDKRAKLGAKVSVGPYTVSDGDVEVGEGTTIGAHNLITGYTRIGRDNRIFHFCSIGEANQDKKYAGEPTRVEIGDRNTIREYTSINRGTMQDAQATVVGSDNWIMAYVHIAHDCRVGDNTVFANYAGLAGHVHIGDWATLGGYVGVHQFVKVGAHLMAAADSLPLHDLAPYVSVCGKPCSPHGINSMYLKRCGFTPQTIMALKRAYRTLYRSKLSLEEARAELEQQAGATPEVRAMVDFIAASTRGILR